MINKSELARMACIDRKTIYRWEKTPPLWLKPILTNENLRNKLKELIK